MAASTEAARTVSKTRVEELVDGARRIADPGDPLGRRARAVLPSSTGLAPENVELCLRECLETEATESEIEALCASVAPAPRIWVNLAANVFTAPLRAIALGLAQSESVYVRPSRREPEFCRLLHEATGAFDLVETLAPEPRDHVWLYGSDETIAEARSRLSAGVVVHAHGSGFGVAVASRSDAQAVAADVVPFDQRGCLSPRIVFAIGDARGFAETLAGELEGYERTIPLGELGPDEAAEVTRFRDTLRYGAEIWPAGRGFVGLIDSAMPWVIPPVGRNVVVIASERLPSPTASFARAVAAIGLGRTDAADIEAWARETFPGARRSPTGRMQRPRFDGPVDLRPRADGEIV